MYSTFAVPIVFTTSCMKTSCGHILVIDDNEEILSTLTIILKKKSYEVSVQSKLDDWEATIKAIHPDLILLDKNLGWIDGCELCQRIKANNNLQRIPVIMFSAYNKKREECLLSGAADFLEKPFQMQHLLQTIDFHLAESKA